MEERENGGERERERQRERERNIDVIEKHRLEASHTPPNRGWNPQPFRVRRGCSNQLSHLGAALLTLVNIEMYIKFM